MHSPDLSSDEDNPYGRLEPEASNKLRGSIEDLSSELLAALPGQSFSVADQTISLTFANQSPAKPLKVDLIVDSFPGCGGRVWPSGQILSSYLVGKGWGSLAGKTVLELGSGTGLVGLVAAMLGGHVWITDQSPLLEIMQRNTLLNGLSETCIVAELNWGEPIPKAVPRPDVILAADCVYFEPAFPLLVQTLDELVDDSTEVLFCYKKRRKADRRFFALLKKKFRWVEVMDDPNRAVYSREAITLLRLIKVKT